MNFGVSSGKRKYASYVGAATAETWYAKGITSVDELARRIEADPKVLSHNQKVMWDYRHCFSQRIPRKEVELIADVVRQVFPSAANVEPCGSFRRGAADCGDVDLLVCVSGDVETSCQQAVERLTAQGFLTSTLKSHRGGAVDSGQWQGGCRLASLDRTDFACYKLHRRLDMKVYPLKERSFAQLYFGSGEGFNRAIRLFATRKGFALSGRGIRRVTRGKNDRGELVTLWEGPYIIDPSGASWSTEASIFAFLSLPFIHPRDRSDATTAADLERLSLEDQAPEASKVMHLEPRGQLVLESSWRARGIVALDCEFVGVGRNTVGLGGERSALGRVSVVDYNGNVLLDTFVRVEEPVVDFRIHITGLTQRHLNTGIDFAEAKSLVLGYLEGRIVVGHSLSNDFKALAISPSVTSVRDIRSCKELQSSAHGRSLKALCKHHLGKDIQDGIHCSVEDARVALALYKCVEDCWDPVCPIADCVCAPTPAHEQLRGAAMDLIEDEVGGNTKLAAIFEQRAATASFYAKEQYLRVCRTLRAVPFTVRSVEDLGRPELHCIGQGKIRSLLEAEVRAMEEQLQSCAVTSGAIEIID